jgi:hypothetical protein
MDNELSDFSRLRHLNSQAREGVKAALGHLVPLDITMAGARVGGPAMAKLIETLHDHLFHANEALHAQNRLIPEN